VIGPYKTAGAFRMALEQHLNDRALRTATPVDRLRKEVALQRLLARMVSSSHADGWVLKGAQVLLVRLDEHARATKDVDTTWRFKAGALRSALDDATAINLEDGFTFEIGAGSRIEAETQDGGWRFSVRARLDGRFFEQFVLDVNIAVDDPRPVELLTLRPVLHFAGFASPTIAAVPIAFHLAEKLHAYVRIYSGSRPSSRVKDLYDMLVMARALPMPRSGDLRSAVSLTFALRQTPLPVELPDPPVTWTAPWAAYVHDYGIEWLTLDSAIAALRPFWSPITSPTEPQLVWDPVAWLWQLTNPVELHENDSGSTNTVGRLLARTPGSLG
jgi:Nucleotidyl transferase AbiEii toxin, Type IV TA system